MFPTRSAARRSTVSVAALLGAAALLFSSVGPAGATTGSAPQIDPSATGSITIHKFAEPAGGGGSGHLGNELPGSATEGLIRLDNVDFTFSLVNDLDLTDAEDWQELDGLTARSTFDSVELVDTVTTIDGVARSKELPLGVYLVEEKVDPQNSNNIVAPVEPFLVSVPTRGPANEWLYNVHAYPKNSVVNLDFVAEDSGALGMNGTGTINWKVTTTVPYLPTATSLDSYAITLDLSDHLTRPTANDITLHVNGDPNPVPKEWYSANLSAAGILTVTPHPSVGGLNAYQGQEIVLTVATKMKKNENQGGVVAAEATVTVNGESTKPTTATSDWGAARIITTAGGEPLAGVKYKVSLTRGGDPIEVNGRTEFETNANGEIVIEGLRIGQDFYLVETGTPLGYTAAGDFPFKVKVADTDTVTTPGSNINVFSFTKEQVSGFVLPITGSFGSLPFILAGLLLVATALIVNRSRRRRLAQAV